MKIIIAGAGRVGSSVAEQLVIDQHEVTIIDTNEAAINAIAEKLELRGVVGDAIDPNVLDEAGAVDAEMIISCTYSDAVNLITSRLAQQLFNIPSRIARLRSPAYQDLNNTKNNLALFAVNGVICPERSITKYVSRLIQYPAAMQISDFCQGLACLVSVRVELNTPMVNKSIGSIRQSLPDLNFNIVAIYRRFRGQADHLIRCNAATELLPGDEVFVLLEKKQLLNVLTVLHGHASPIQRVFFAGGGNVTQQLAKSIIDFPQLEQIKIIEKNEAQCIKIASELPDQVIVLNGDACDEALLRAENIEQADIFLSVTEDDEVNIMSCLLAKQFGAKRALNLIHRRSYADLVHGTEIDVSLSPAQVMMDEILTFVRTQNIREIYSLRRGKAETIEIEVHGQAGFSKVVGKKIGEIKLPEGASIGLIAKYLTRTVDGEETELDKVKILAAYDNYIVEAQDVLVIFLPDKLMVPAIEKTFAVAARL